MAALRPCPECNEAERLAVLSCGGHWFSVHCSRCHYDSEPGRMRRGAVRAWNRMTVPADEKGT